MTSRPKDYHSIMARQGDENALATGHATPTDSVQVPPAKSKSTMVITAVVATVLMIFVGFSASTLRMEGPTKSLDVPVEGMALLSKTRDCVFQECLDASCNAATAPYLCVFHNGGPHGGCSPVPWSEETCDDSCNVSPCTTLPFPDDVSSCKNQKCSREWCEAASMQRCGPTVPYQCTQGAGRLGCSDDPYHWVLNGCNSCCDVASCE